MPFVAVLGLSFSLPTLVLVLFLLSRQLSSLLPSISLTRTVSAGHATKSSIATNLFDVFILLVESFALMAWLQGLSQLLACLDMWLHD